MTFSLTPQYSLFLPIFYLLILYPYIVPVRPVIRNIINHTVDLISVGEVNMRYITLIINKPVSADRTDVIGFSITNSQNDEVLRVRLAQSNVTIVLAPGEVTFNVTTIYGCPSLSDPVPYIVPEGR